VPSAADQTLLERHLPILRYDSQGSFMADSPAVLTDRVASDGKTANCLKRADGTLLASAKAAAGDPKLDLGFLAPKRYGEGSAVAKSDYVDAVGRDYVQQARELHREPYKDRVYGHVARDGDGGRWLQYWLFYLYNDKAFLGFGLHEGDWEMVQIKLGQGDRPDAMAFAQHAHGQRCDWALVEKRGDRPVVYVARGSQASFPFPGRHSAPVVPDYADGRGPEVSPALEPIDDGAPAWVGWPGRWGSTKARNRFESNSPRGPAQHGQWDDPATFHEEADQIDPRRMAPEPAPPAPAAPKVRVRRADDHAEVSYTLGRGGPAPTRLVVSVDGAKDDLPPATYGFAIEGASGSETHPLELGDDSYRVSVSVADAAGNFSEPVERTLKRPQLARRRGGG
jgi:hypothetical protein